MNTLINPVKQAVRNLTVDFLAARDFVSDLAAEVGRAIPELVKTAGVLAKAVYVSNEDFQKARVWWKQWDEENKALMKARKPVPGGFIYEQPGWVIREGKDGRQYYVNMNK